MVSSSVSAGNASDKIFIFYDQEMKYILNGATAETLEETIESGPQCITDLFQNKISL